MGAAFATPTEMLVFFSMVYAIIAPASNFMTFMYFEHWRNMTLAVTHLLRTSVIEVTARSLDRKSVV